MKSIGIQHESALHRELKFRYARGGDVEIERDGYVCDAVEPGGAVIEIQTGSFGPLKKKLSFLTAGGPVRLIHPVIVSKTIELFDTEGNLLSKRKSPKKGSFWDIFAQLIYAPCLALLPNLTIEAVLVDAAERRIADGKGSWRRKGVSIDDKILSCCRETIVLSGPADYRRHLPFKRGEEFNSGLLAEKARINTVLAQKVLYVLHSIGVVRRIRREGRYWIYTALK